MINYKFSKKNDKLFYEELTSKVNAYFFDNGLTTYANFYVIFKIIIIYTLYLLFYLLIIFGSLQLKIFCFIWILLGLTHFAVGFNIMHDALHGSLFKNKQINNIVGSIASFLIGQYPQIWEIQHNNLHHIYPNIETIDGDIDKPPFRFSPNQKLHWYHKYQHIYATFLYLFTNISIITDKDFVQLSKFRKMYLIKSDQVYLITLLKIILFKVFYLLAYLWLPYKSTGYHFGLILSMFILMNLISGILFIMIIMPNHITHNSKYSNQKNRDIKNNWFVHQLLNTTNYSINNKLFNFFIGSINLHIEHHLFPNICHIHYPQIAPIIKRTCDRYNVPYYHEKTWFSAIKKHYQMLYYLGNTPEELDQPEICMK
jgi:linoleoyl-CoA desaturase